MTDPVQNAADDATRERLGTVTVPRAAPEKTQKRAGVLSRTSASAGSPWDGIRTVQRGFPGSMRLSVAPLRARLPC